MGKERRQAKRFGWTIEEKAKETNIIHIDISPTVSRIPPWLRREPNIDFTLLSKKTRDKGFGLYLELIKEYSGNSYCGYVQIYMVSQ